MPSSAPPARRTVCVLGSFMMDLVARCQVRPADGETVIGDGFDMFLGGKGFNQAVAAARSGAPTRMLGRLGDDDFGRSFLAALDRERIDRSGVSIDPVSGTGVGLPVVEASGRNSIVVIPRANHQLTVADVGVQAELIATSGVLLLQWELPVDTAVEAARLAKAAGVMVVLNPAPAVGQLEQFAGLVDVIAPNETEAAAFARAPDALREMVGAGAVVLTLGEKGALVLDGDGSTALPAHDVDCVDTVGAGDAFCGAMAAALAAGADIVEAARLGNAAGALAVTKPGAEPSMPHRADIDALLAR